MEIYKIFINNEIDFLIQDEIIDGIKKEELLESIRTALITAYKRNFDALENVDVKMDEKTGATHVYAIKEVMERANDDALEISLEDAKKINKTLKIGDSVEVEIVPRDFGRIAAQTAKQVIIQKLRETERNMIFNEYNERKGEIVSGIIQKADKHIVVMDLGRNDLRIGCNFFRYPSANSRYAKFFKEVFEKVEASDFLKGKNNRDWVATFDWIIKDSNMAKILDGNYDNAGGNNGKVQNTEWNPKTHNFFE